MKFPKMKKNQVALLRSDTLTGNVLDVNFEIHISDSQIGYSIFNSEEEALIYINKIKSERKNIELTLLDFNEKVIYYNDGL